jgi:Protein of unknown function (DUF4199)
MKRIVLTFGLISGGLLAVMMTATMPFMDKIGFDKGMVIGYTTMVLAFLLVFFGIRSYRETVGNGQISFLRALGVGLLIMTIAAACYVVTWEILYHTFIPDFADKCVAYEIQKVRASGKSLQEMEAEIESMKSMMALYQSNILFNIAITFLEPLPVGVPMTLLSALILRRRKRQEQDLHGFQDAVKGTSVNPV